MNIKVTPEELKMILEGLNARITYFQDMEDDYEEGDERCELEIKSTFNLWSRLYKTFCRKGE